MCRRDDRLSLTLDIWRKLEILNLYIQKTANFSRPVRSSTMTLTRSQYLAQQVIKSDSS